MPMIQRLFLALLLAAPLAVVAADYFPPRHGWMRCPPSAVGMAPDLLADAVAFAQINDNPAPRDQALAWTRSFGAREPWFGGILGPMQTRAAINGLIVYRGRVVAEWGDTARVDMSHSISKSFLSATVGLAWQQGLIRSTDDRVADYLPPEVDLFASPHNAPITWDHLLRQTSDWQGELWGRPDWADRPKGDNPEQWPNRPRHAPGSVFTYNDVRINVLALAALQIMRRPLPQVLREGLMDPIGASRSWRWHGYGNSWVELDGQRMQSVSGGGHWGGGMFIDAWDMARFGYLYLRQGEWNGRQVVAREWIEKSRKPGSANDAYGYANWFLNTGRKALPAAPETAVTFRGNGQNIIHIDWDNDLLLVVRWIDNGDALNQFIGRVMQALPETSELSPLPQACSAQQPAAGN